MSVYIIDEQTECSINSETLENQIKTILPLLNCQNKELSILLTADKKIRELNNNTAIKIYPQMYFHFLRAKGKKMGWSITYLGI